MLVNTITTSHEVVTRHDEVCLLMVYVLIIMYRTGLLTRIMKIMDLCHRFLYEKTKTMIKNMMMTILCYIMVRPMINGNIRHM